MIFLERGWIFFSLFFLRIYFTDIFIRLPPHGRSSHTVTCEKCISTTKQSVFYIYAFLSSALAEGKLVLKNYVFSRCNRSLSYTPLGVRRSRSYSLRSRSFGFTVIKNVLFTVICEKCISMTKQSTLRMSVLLFSRFLITVKKEISTTLNSEFLLFKVLRAPRAKVNFFITQILT
jgi:hypothetical protein